MSKSQRFILAEIEVIYRLIGSGELHLYLGFTCSGFNLIVLGPHVPSNNLNTNLFWAIFP